MGFLKKAWRAVKSGARQLARTITEVAHLILGLPDLLLGFLTLWPKKLRIKVLILSDESGNAITSTGSLTESINFAERVFKDRLNVKLLPSRDQPMVEVIPEPAPTAALDVHCGPEAWQEDFGEAGEFFDHHLAGLVYPVTGFVVRNVVDKQGCSLGLLTDYVTLDPDGVKSGSTLAHEIGHACNLPHVGSKSNLMWRNADRGDKIKWWQKNLFRSSRHVTFW